MFAMLPLGEDSLLSAHFAKGKEFFPATKEAGGAEPPDRKRNNNCLP
jgi:hypothetical protein